MSCSSFYWNIVRVFYEIVQSKALKGKLFVPVSIFIGGKKLDLKALVDTGNSLHDPLSNLPVVIVELDSIKEMLPQNFCRYSVPRITMISKVLAGF